MANAAATVVAPEAIVFGFPKLVFNARKMSEEKVRRRKKYPFAKIQPVLKRHCEFRERGLRGERENHGTWRGRKMITDTHTHILSVIVIGAYGIAKTIECNEKCAFINKVD